MGNAFQFLNVYSQGVLEQRAETLDAPAVLLVASGQHPDVCI